MRVSTVVYAASSVAVPVGLFLVLLYFFDIVPGQPTRGVLFYLRMGGSLMVAVPIIVAQILINAPKAERAQIAEKIGFILVLAIGLILGMLLLPQMYTGTTWSP